LAALPFPWNNAGWPWRYKEVGPPVHAGGLFFFPIKISLDEPRHSAIRRFVPAQKKAPDDAGAFELLEAQ
jgi:hypothetical protein